jgi:KaiC/GvpD/RAD55 family RecA-like ATPase
MDTSFRNERLSNPNNSFEFKKTNKDSFSKPSFDFSVINNQITPHDIEDECNVLLRQPKQVGLFSVRTANQCLMDAKEQPIPRDLFYSLVFENEITILFADTGVGKSIFSVQIANDISETDKVLYIDLELSDKQFQKRYSENYTNEFVFRENFIRSTFFRPFKVPEDVDYDTYFVGSLTNMIMTTETKIIIIDNLTKILSSDTDTARKTKPLMDLLCDLKFEFGLTMLLLEHTRKTDNSRPICLNDLQGSKMKANFADAVFTIGRSAKDKNLRYVKQLKVRSCEFEFDSENVLVYEVVKEDSFLGFQFIEYGNEGDHLKQLTDNERENRHEQILDLKNKGLSNVEIGKRLGISEAAVRKQLKKG